MNSAEPSKSDRTVLQFKFVKSIILNHCWEASNHTFNKWCEGLCRYFLLIYRSISSRKKLHFRLFPITIASFLILFFGYILPSHHHTDGQEHPECALCQLQSTPTENTVGFCIIFLALSLIAIFGIGYHFYSSIFTSVYFGRAPPHN